MDRIVAISHIDETGIYIFGRGIHESCELPPEEVRSMGVGQYVIDKNPKLVMDNGDIVWGCECWWMPEADFDAINSRGNIPIHTISIDAAREEANNAPRDS